MVWMKMEWLNYPDTNGITDASVVIAEYSTIITSDEAYRGNKVMFVNLQIYSR